MILEKLKDHFENKKYTKLIRSVGKHTELISHGYIIAYSNDFVLLHENYDFLLIGYCIFPVSQIKKVRFTKYDKYFHQLIIREGVINNVGINYSINLDNWTSVFNSIRAEKSNVIIECEHPDIDSFTIGPISKVTKKQVFVLNFDPQGYFDNEPTKTKFEDITRICFDDNYINTMSKYMRHHKNKK